MNMFDVFFYHVCAVKKKKQAMIIKAVKNQLKN